jgi:peptidoglycan/LPS O-acetylase OafA/YrhL
MSSAPTAHPARRVRPGPAAATVLRTDIQGLRAVAVTMVLLFHLWPGRLGGGFAGVDVFFVISGFLITSHLLAHPPSGFRDLATFWSRRVRRLLPASLLVLIVTTVATWRFAPDTQWATTAKDIAAAGLYVVNWRLAATSVDYLAAENAASPVQHFWSLSVEEQFYFVWPILILLLVAVAVRRHWNMTTVVSVGLGSLVLCSLGYSVLATRQEPASAYFVTPTRMWELGIGGLLAVVASASWSGRRSPDRYSVAAPLTAYGRSVLAWLGLAAIAFTAFAYSGSTPFPGWQALLPVLGAAAFIAAESPLTRWSPGPGLALRPVQWLGDVSYSVYLWHWPLVVLVPYAVGHQLGTGDKLAIVVATLLLAGITKSLVEDKFRRPEWGRPLRKPFILGAAGMAVVVASTLLLTWSFQQREEAARDALASAVSGDQACFGAAALDPHGSCPPTLKGPVVPAPAEAVNDKSQAYDQHCWAYAPHFELHTCVFGDPRGKVQVALVGNSHAGEWLPAVQRIAERRGWRVTTYLASECSATRARLEWDAAGQSSACWDWGDKVLRTTTTGKFDLVITSERNDHAAAGRTMDTSMAAWREGYREYLRGWLGHGVHVAVIHDTPFPGSTLGNIPDCIAQHLDDLSVCRGKRADWVPVDPLVGAARDLADPRVTTIDLTDRICGQDTCAGAVGGVTVYFDGSHLSATYNATLAPYLAGPLAEAVRGATG